MPGQFASELKKAIAESKLSSSEIERISKGVVSPSRINAYISGRNLPDKLRIVDTLARILKRDPVEFRKFAAMDWIDRGLIEYEVSLEDACNLEKRSEKYVIPLYNFENLAEQLSPQGYPATKPAMFIEVLKDCGKYAYAFRVEDSSLSPRVMKDEVVIVSPGAKINKGGDYAVIGIEGKIMLGRVQEHYKDFIIETLAPYHTLVVKKRLVRFISKVSGIYCEDSCL